jgi:transposase
VRAASSRSGVEAVNSLAKRVKRVAFGITNWTHWRVRVLLYAGRPDRTKLATISPVAPGEPPKSLRSSH